MKTKTLKLKDINWWGIHAKEKLLWPICVKASQNSGRLWKRTKAKGLIQLNCN